MAKSAMAMMVREWAKTLGRYSIRINALVPGAIAAGGFVAGGFSSARAGTSIPT